ncbi:MAG: aldehyde ferredoxin oxidoreductase family protein [Gammaproteobacteria bacterium]|nr:aldehyde ferredoxin oxidoreductase family protein [Gammaproteobacteria bacterium]NIR83157.1 aldehyde ferredoxin oxidoreductase family protein [Gammaproteobacteria bacterium]NIR90965.1 aldehyde ferredoxin oxidoreductase family protein [Gammaproteobacteria bacterium]NIU04322.1 aldehyde ferredoxin oxidoreductase family protein [Gammaproteobacteria bacterium]NIV52545.1 aldehyde ferredoxin oxidoreductase [Gammaproteobacteria bacterium]
MGWQKKILRVDLARGTVRAEPLNMEWAHQYLGERGLATKYLWESMDPAADPMGPENVLIFATGPLTGTMASTSGRYAVVTKGPLTGAIACSNSGGKFGAELKYAGYDLLILEGRSPQPVYLHIVDDEVEILSADDIWGTTVWHTEEWLKARHQNPLLKVASIGVAGERGVRFSCIVNDLHRAAGRSGVGAVMGSKNLKAIAVHGKVGVRVDDPKRFMHIVKETHALLWDNDGRRELTELGTNAMMDSMQEFGGLPTRNFREVQFEGYDKIDAAAMKATKPNGHRNLITNKACFGCTIACGRIAHIDKDHFTIVNRKEYWHASGGLEYETAFAFGPVVGVDDIDALTFAGFLMNEHGMDPISFGVTLAAAMELYEMGVITEVDTDGVPLNFGNAEALTVMAEKTGKHEGFGQVLALGSRRLCEKYGHPELSMTVKGQEFAGYDSRALQGMGLGYATGNRGACHLKHDVFAEDMEDQTGHGKAKPCKDSQDQIATIDSTGLCLFTTAAWGIEEFQRQIDAACEGEWTVQRLLETGERIWNVERQFNLAAGLSGADDRLPDRMLKDPAPSGTAKGRVNELDRMLPEYYALRGWTPEGVPTPETLARLGLGK